VASGVWIGNDGDLDGFVSLCAVRVLVLKDAERR
jgi:hypothetical protein